MNFLAGGSSPSQSIFIWVIYMVKFDILNFAIFVVGIHITAIFMGLPFDYAPVCWFLAVLWGLLLGAIKK